MAHHNDRETGFSIGNQSFAHVGDLEYFDGALLSLFVEKQWKRPYLLHWLDVSADFHKWYFFQVPPYALSLYLDGKLSNHDLFGLAPSVKIIELNGDMEVGEVTKISKNNLPDGYAAPSPDGFFEPSTCPDLVKIQAFLARYAFSESEKTALPALAA